MSWRGERIGGMTREEMNEFLAGPWLARVACVKPDGSPYVVPTWYHWDGVAFWVVPRERSAWAHYMARDPRVCLVVDEPEPPIRKVICEGTAVVVEAAVGPYLVDHGILGSRLAIPSGSLGVLQHIGLRWSATQVRQSPDRSCSC